jgi:hypothetical protein
MLPTFNIYIMKKLTLILLVFCAFTTKAHNLVMNGSFEYNNIKPEDVDCPIDIHNDDFNALIDSTISLSDWALHTALFFEGCLNMGTMVPDSIAYEGEVSLLIASKDTIVGLATPPSHWQSRLGVTMELSQILLPGSYYKLSYYQKVLPPNTLWTHYTPGAMEIGISERDTSFGVVVDTIAYNDYNWEKIEFVFKATIPAKYLSVRGVLFFEETDAAVVDNFVLTFDSFAVLGVNEYKPTKQLHSITDVLGRESKPTPNVPLFYRYDDGTVEKKLIIE